jgi:hypothetical protein
MFLSRIFSQVNLIAKYKWSFGFIKNKKKEVILSEANIMEKINIHKEKSMKIY